MIDQSVHETAGFGLPGRIVGDLLGSVDVITNDVNQFLDFQVAEVDQIMGQLRQDRFIESLEPIIDDPIVTQAVAGNSSLERLMVADLLLLAAVASSSQANSARQIANRYMAHATIATSGDKNIRLLQGLRQLLEMLVVKESLEAEDGPDLVMVSGSHLTPIIKLNSLLTAQSMTVEPADLKYVEAFDQFVYKYASADLAEIVRAFGFTLSDNRVFNLVKNSPARDFLKTVVPDSNINIDDKTFFSIGLHEGEYTTPLPIGQGPIDRRIWEELHMSCSLDVADPVGLADGLNYFLNRVRPGPNQLTDICYLYFKITPRIAHRIEVKGPLARDSVLLNRVLNDLKRQTASPFILEPISLSLANMMIQDLSLVKKSVQEAILHHDDFKVAKDHIHLFNNNH